MGLPNVYITVNRSGLGLIAYTNDGIMGIVVSGASVVEGIQVGEPRAMYSLSDAENLGITEDDNPTAYKQIKEYYDEAGNGQKVWIVLSDGNSMSDSVSGTSNVVRTLIEAGNGEISLIGLCRGVNQSGSIVDGLDNDVAITMQAAQILADEYQEKIMPVSFVIDGIGFSGDENSVADLHTMTKHRCSIILAASEDDGVASVGQFVGRLASIPVQRKASRIKDGELTNLKAYLTDGATVDNRMPAMGVLHDKGYIVYRVIPGRTGYFYSGDPTATLPTDDLNIIARNRVMDKVIKIAYNVYSEELDDDVPVDDQGNVEPAVCGNLQTKIEQQVNGNMEGEISSFSAFVDPVQNILSGRPFEVVLSIVPRGYLNAINVTIGFTNPFNN